MPFKSTSKYKFKNWKQCQIPVACVLLTVVLKCQNSSFKYSGYAEYFNGKAKGLLFLFKSTLTLQSAPDNWAGLSSIISPSLWTPATWGKFICLAMCLMMQHMGKHYPGQKKLVKSPYLKNVSLLHQAVHNHLRTLWWRGYLGGWMRSLRGVGLPPSTKTSDPHM